MPIRWNTRQLREVQAALNKFHAGSSKCAAAARTILPLARELDANAQGIHLRPKDAAPYLLTRSGSRKFFHHVVVDVTKHRVDALTGPPGHPSNSYLSAYFQHPDGIAEFPVDVNTIDPGIQSDDAS